MSTLTRFRGGGLAPFDWTSLPLFPFLTSSIRIEEYLEGDHYIVRAELPGVDPTKDVTVTYANGELRLHVVRADEHKDRTRSEFHYGSFYRTVSLPRAAKEDTITAEYVDGILTIKVLVGEGEATGKAIPITVGEGKK